MHFVIEIKIVIYLAVRQGTYHGRLTRPVKTFSYRRKLASLFKLCAFLFLEKEEILRKHKELLKSLEDERQNELTQLRLKCASDTANQVGSICIRPTYAQSSMRATFHYKHLVGYRFLTKCNRYVLFIPRNYR